MIANELGGIAWRKSSFSNGANACVEVGWRKSSFSSDGADCVEVAPTPPGIAVRDSKNPDEGILGFGDSAWQEFLATL
jgi:hypothetical protein